MTTTKMRIDGPLGDELHHSEGLAIRDLKARLALATESLQNLYEAQPFSDRAGYELCKDEAERVLERLHDVDDRTSATLEVLDKELPANGNLPPTRLRQMVRFMRLILDELVMPKLF